MGSETPEMLTKPWICTPRNRGRANELFFGILFEQAPGFSWTKRPSHDTRTKALEIEIGV